jgi:quercetin dioxygenase-like cupin family protein
MTAPDTSPRLVTEDQAPWAEVQEGVHMRMLTTFGEGTGYTAMFRFAPGVRLPKHHHLGRVHAYTLSGRWRYLEHDWIAEAGSYALEQPGGVHTLVVPEDASEPAVVLFIVESGMVILSDDGTPQLVLDTHAMAEIYRAATG